MTFSRRGLMSRLTRTVLALAAVGTLGVAGAQTPKTIKLMVGFPPGGGTDAIARILAERLKDELGTPVIVENKPGAGGHIAAQALQAAPADGSTYFLGCTDGAQGWVDAAEYLNPYACGRGQNKEGKAMAIMDVFRRRRGPGMAELDAAGERIAGGTLLSEEEMARLRSAAVMGEAAAMARRPEEPVMADPEVARARAGEVRGYVHPAELFGSGRDVLGARYEARPSAQHEQDTGFALDGSMGAAGQLRASLGLGMTKEEFSRRNSAKLAQQMQMRRDDQQQRIIERQQWNERDRINAPVSFGGGAGVVRQPDGTYKYMEPTPAPGASTSKTVRV